MKKELCQLFGPSGLEKEVCDFISRQALPYADEMFTDRLGNLFVFRKGNNEGNKLVISAHMDEVGFMLRYIGDEGEIYFETVGGFDPAVLAGKRVLVGKNKLPGVISAKAIHMQTAEERKKFTPVDKMYIDIGACSKEDAEKLVSIGEYAAFVPNYEEFGDGFVKSKAIDDRFGCAAMLEILKDKPEYSTWFAFVTREEIGLRGATAAAYTLQPDIAVIAESTTAADINGVSEATRVCRLGNGPALSFMDNSTVYDTELFKKVCQMADKDKLLYQIKNLVAGGNDSGAYRHTGVGSKTVTVSVPTRYIHSSSSVAKLSDYENTVKLIAAIINCKEIREDNKND